MTLWLHLGPNSSKPHAVPTDRQIQSGDVIILDFGCKYKGYCSDMTRTIFVDCVQDSIKSVYDLVLKNQLLTAKEIYDGANVRLITKMVENDFKLHNYDLIHALGHNLGLEIHEEPRLSSRVDFLLKENMTLTNEPGIYIPGKFGVRIEDFVIIKENGCENMTLAKKNLISL